MREKSKTSQVAVFGPSVWARWGQGEAAVGRPSTWVWGSLPKRVRPALSSQVSFQKGLGFLGDAGVASVVPYIGMIVENEGF